MINNSETFRPVTEQLYTNECFSDIVLLHETAFSRLYRAKKAGKYFAIKTTKDNSGMQVAMLKREYDMTVSLSHHHIPYIYTYESNTPVGAGIVMEYVEGRNLSEFLAERPSLQNRCRVMEQLFTAVAYIHKNGIIHNDLKPENILITNSDDDVKLLDFGLSDKDAYFLAQNSAVLRNTHPRNYNHKMSRLMLVAISILSGKSFKRFSMKKNLSTLQVAAHKKIAICVMTM